MIWFYNQKESKTKLSSPKLQNKNTNFLNSVFPLRLLATNIPQPPKEEKKLLIIRHHIWYQVSLLSLLMLLTRLDMET